MNGEENEDKEDVLSDEEYDKLYEGMLKAGIDDPDQIKDIVEQYEEAALQMSVLDLLMSGDLIIKGVNENGELTFGAPSTVADSSDESILPKGFTPPKRFDLN